MRKTVQEKSEALRQRADSTKPDAAADTDDATADASDDAETKPRAASTASSTTPGDDVAATASSKINSLFSSIGGITLETSFGSLNFGEVGSKLLHTADELLGSLAGEHDAVDDDDDDALAARRFRLLALQEDAETYTEPPMDTETFLKWRAATPPAELESVQADVLEHYPAVVDKFAELVPSVIDAESFWAHYIYKASLLAAQEQRGADLLEHALNDSEEEIGWGDADSPRAGDSDNSEEKKTAAASPAAAAFFPDDESKEDAPVAATATADAPKVDSSSSDGESWTDLDDRKAPLSSSSAASAAQDAKAVAAAVATAAAATPAAAAVSTTAGDDDEELDWGDDDIVPEGVLSGDESSTAESAPAFHEEPKKRAGDWGEWD